MSSLFKRLSISSTRSAKSSGCSVPVNAHPSPLDVTFALDIQSSSVPTTSWAPPASYDGGYARMLDDDNMSWGTGKTSKSRSKRFKRLSFF